MTTNWDDFAQVVRSYEDDRVWVPVIREADQAPFLHSGGLRRVKDYIIRTHLPPEVERYRWRRDGPDEWVLEVRWL